MTERSPGVREPARTGLLLRGVELNGRVPADVRIAGGVIAEIGGRLA